MKKLFSSLSATLCLLLPGCKDTYLEHHKDRTPTIDLQSFFDGTVTGHGSFFNWRGIQSKSFTLTMIGTFNTQGKGPLKEHFIFDDGSKLDREWTCTFHNDKTYSATAPDIVGTGTGRQIGNAAHTNYVITIPYNNSSINITMDDWCYQIDEKTVLNRAVMKKFGIKVGEMIVVLTK